MNEPAIIWDNGAKYLALRWIACYLQYDDNIDHAQNAYHNSIADWEEEARSRIKRDGGSDLLHGARLTRSLNRVLAEAVDELIEHNSHGGKNARQELEFQMAISIAQYGLWFNTTSEPNASGAQG